MDPLTLGIIGVVVIFALVLLQVPIAIALVSVSFLGISALIGFGPALSLVGRLPHEFAASWEFSAVPMFLLMGAVAYHTGMTTDLYNAARIWFGRLPGGLAIATNFACAGFGAASGSSLATTAAMGRIAIPEMLKLGYNPGLATGVCASAGTLGALIPPSIALIVYGILAEQSVAKLFIAGIVPGLLTAGIYAGMIALRCWANPALAPAMTYKVSWTEKFFALFRIWPLLLLIAGVIGGIYSGYFSPTEAGGVGAFLAIVISLLRRRLTLANLRAAIREALMATAALLFVATGAVMLTRFLALTGLADAIATFVGGFALDPLIIILAMSLIYLLLGMILDPLGLMLMTIPVFLPLFEQMGINLIWFGIIVVKYVEIGLLTPPVGLNVYAVKTLLDDQIKIETVFRGVLWFLAAEVVIMALLLGFPELTLFLPELMQ